MNTIDLDALYAEELDEDWAKFEGKISDEKISEIITYLYTNDRKLNFCGHDFSEDALRNIIRKTLEMSVG